jgi:hypothetical protein
MERMTDDLDGFRAETRAWLEANCPPEMRVLQNYLQDVAAMTLPPIDEGLEFDKQP